MIIVRLLGGLGNQLFQYAAGRAAAEKYGTELLLDGSYFSDDHGMVPRPFELDKFNCRIRFALPGQIDRLINRGRLARLTDAVSGHRRLHLKENQPLPAPDSKGKTDLYLDGYWQSENHFSAIKGSIREELTFRGPFNALTENLAGEIGKNENAVSVHIRRGDYLSSEAMKNWLGVCSPDYYQKAFEHVSGRIGQPAYYVFSDDLDWVNEHIVRDNKNMHPVVHNRGNESWQDMYLMSRCRHHIIANSSFSWWGAWLDPGPEKIVVAPDKWFLSSALYDQVKDIVPNGWTRF
jgi:hypothetical protein